MTIAADGFSFEKKEEKKRRKCGTDKKKHTKGKERYYATALREKKPVLEIVSSD